MDARLRHVRPHRRVRVTGRKTLVVRKRDGANDRQGKLDYGGVQSVDT
jgi:hypothetical protein